MGDCSIRAMCAALDLEWDDAYTRLCLEGYAMKDMPSSNAVWGRFLRRNGFTKRAFPDSCVDGYTVEDFARDHPSGVYVLALSGHVACVRDGVLMDTWDSSQEIVIYYFERTD